jgi:hypothetical protein
MTMIHQVKPTLREVRRLRTRERTYGAAIAVIVQLVREIETARHHGDVETRRAMRDKLVSSAARRLAAR